MTTKICTFTVVYACRPTKSAPAAAYSTPILPWDSGTETERGATHCMAHINTHRWKTCTIFWACRTTKSAPAAAYSSPILPWDSGTETERGAAHCMAHINTMGVARILEWVVQTTSHDKGDVTMVTACLSPHSSQHTYTCTMCTCTCMLWWMVMMYGHDVWLQVGDDNSRSWWSSTTLPPGSARHTSSTTPSLVSAVFRWKRWVILLLAVGESAVDCLCCRFDIVYAVSALNLHLIKKRQDFWLEYIYS